MAKVWQAQAGCCDYCSGLDGQSSSELDGKHPPAHPNCQCEMVDDGDVKASETRKHLTRIKNLPSSNSMHSFRSPVIALAEGTDGKAPQKIQLLRVGTFLHSNGKQFTVSPETILKLAENFKKGTRKSDIPIDYKHDNDDVAAGWIRGVEPSADGTQLWAEVEWTPKGAQVITEKEFRYFSPEFHPNYQDNESLKYHGPTLLGGGLTNRPIIKGMEPVIQLHEFSEAAASPTPEGQKKPKENPVKAAEMPTDPAQIDAMEPDALKALCKSMMAEMASMKTASSQMAEKVAGMETAQKCAEKKASFAKMLSEGKVVAAQEQAWIDGDVIKFAELSKPLNPAAAGNGAPGEGAAISTKADAQAEVLKLAEVKMTEKKAKNKGEAISLVLAERKDLSKLVNE